MHSSPPPSTTAADAVEFLRSKLKNYKTNVEFLLSIDPERMSTW